jgi:hypothetical protein
MLALAKNNASGRHKHLTIAPFLAGEKTAAPFEKPPFFNN